MRYSDLDIVSTLDVRAGEQSVKPSAMDDTVSKHSKDLHCNETALNEILDNCSISDEDCSTERTDNSNDNNGTEPDESHGNRKSKKRVMFKCGDNLVMIREIPPRESNPDSDTSEESCSDSESESSEEDSDESSNSCNNKVNIETRIVKKPNARVSKIIREAPLLFKDLKPKEHVVKRPTKKRIAKRIKKESLSKEDIQNKNVEKISIKPKQIQLKTQEKDVLKVSESKLIKSHIRKKKISINRTESPTLKTNIDCKNSKIILSERLKRKPNKSLLEKRDRNNIPPKSLVTSEDFIEESVISDISQSTDRPLSQTDNRLYSWLLANGRIPGPEQRSPCISPMWDTKQSGFTLWENKQTGFSNKSVVKAPT